MDDRFDGPLEPVPTGVELELRKPSWSENKHLLVAGDVVVGRYDRRAVKDEGSAEASTGAWRFVRAGGLLSSRLAVLDAATGAELAAFGTRLLGRGGTLTFGDGLRSFDLRAGGFTDARWSWSRSGDREPLATIRLRSFGEVKATAELTAAGGQDRLGGLLVLFGCHVAMRSRRQSSAAAGAAAASAGAAGS